MKPEERKRGPNRGPNRGEQIADTHRRRNAAPSKLRMSRERIRKSNDLFRATGHFLECSSAGCDETRCAAARFVTRWNEWGGGQ